MTWLGKNVGVGLGRESFPVLARIRIEQVRTLLSFSGKHVVGISNTSPAFYALTSTGITEIHVEFGIGTKPGEHSPAVLWLAKDGKQLAAVKFIGTGAFDNGPYKAYLRTPKMRDTDKANEKTFDRLWGLGVTDAIPEIREYIKQTWQTNGV